MTSFSFLQSEYSYPSGGYIFEMRENLTLQSLRELNWLDEQTAAIFVEFTLFNPNVNLFQTCVILFEVISSGNFIKSSLFYSIDIYSMSNVAIASIGIIFNIVYLVFICILMICELREVIKMKMSYFKQVYNLAELCIVGFSWTAFVMYLNRLYAVYEISKTLKAS